MENKNKGLELELETSHVSNIMEKIFYGDETNFQYIKTSKLSSRRWKSVVSAMAAMCHIYVKHGHKSAENLKIYVCHRSVALEKVLVALLKWF